MVTLRPFVVLDLSPVNDMEEQLKKYEKRISNRILKETLAITMVLCVFILTGFIAGLCYCSNLKSISVPLLTRILLINIAIICLATVVQIVLLYRTSRRAAKDIVKPLIDSLEREKAFTSYASHELRTPLAVIKGSLEVLIRKSRTEEEYRQKISDNIRVVDNMNQMVDNLLTLTRVENGKTKLSMSNLSVKDILTEACSLKSDVMLQRDLKVSLEVYPEDIYVYTDHTALLTILTNIISNAAKYCNESGYIYLRAKPYADTILIEVENSGPGIPAAETKRVFEPFYRSIDSGHQRIKGYGLGLAIVSRFAQMIHAQIQMNSSEKGPTTVQVYLQK